LFAFLTAAVLPLTIFNAPKILSIAEGLCWLSAKSTAGVWLDFG